MSPCSALIGIGVTRRAAGKAGEVVADAVEHAAIEVEQVHLVDGQDEVRDAEQVRDARVAPRLLAHAVPGVDEQDGDVGRRRAGRHVARVLLVARRVGEDELPPRGCEVAVGDVDRDALLALGAQAVGEEREIDRTGGPVAATPPRPTSPGPRTPPASRRAAVPISVLFPSSTLPAVQMRSKPGHQK